MTSTHATLIGFSAILMWSLLALLTVASGDVPPFQLAAMTFAIGGAIGAVWVTWSGAWGALRQSPRAWALGVGGLFGYHALYFISLRLAPPAEAGLVNYLWPLLIVLFSGLLPGEKLRWYSVAGAVVGFAGTAILFAGKGLEGVHADAGRQARAISRPLQRPSSGPAIRCCRAASPMCRPRWSRAFAWRRPRSLPYAICCLKRPYGRETPRNGKR